MALMNHLKAIHSDGRWDFVEIYLTLTTSSRCAPTQDSTKGEDFLNLVAYPEYTRVY